MQLRCLTSNSTKDRKKSETAKLRDATTRLGNHEGCPYNMSSFPQESVIRRMTRLAIAHNAVNLSQGITDEPVCYDLAWAGIAAILGGSDKRAAQLQTLTLGDLLSRHAGRDHRHSSLKALCAILQPERDRYNQYSFPYGLPELRAGIADYTLRFHAFRPDPETQITVTAGATEGLSSVLRALCRPGDGLMVLQPFHEMYPNQAHLFGLRCEYVTLRENRAGWELDKSEWTAVAKRARALILNTPHNPTGKVFSRAELGFIADLCCKHDLFLITDEIYEHILYGDHIHRSPATLPHMAARTIVVNAITKTANASGWRVGWVISPEQYTPKIRAIHDTLIVQAPTPLQKGAAHLLRLPDAIFKAIRKPFLQKRDLLVHALRSAGFKITPPDGAYYLFANYRGVPALCNMDATDAALYMTREIGVAPVPGDNFYRAADTYSPTGRRQGKIGHDGDRYLRFAFCLTLDSLRQAAERMKKLK